MILTFARTMVAFFLVTSLIVTNTAEASYAASLEKMSNTESPQNEESESQDDDPLESFNRFMFAFNELFDGVILRPLALVYDTITPEPVQDIVGNFLDNLLEPVTFMNDLLQLKPEAAGQTLARFAMNSTLGVGGLFDVADEWADIKRHKEDFGQTMGAAGVGSGPYLVLPFIGPSSFRDMIGKAVDVITDPVDYALRRSDRDTLIYVRKGVDAVHRRAKALPLTDSIDKTATDKYIRIRTLYTQHRHFKVKDGNVPVSEEDSVEMVE
tara:strand:+ start:1662 stop:2465 length:804 start_codon:yes stop_codon:yes gene_type:complete